MGFWPAQVMSVNLEFPRGKALDIFSTIASSSKKTALKLYANWHLRKLQKLPARIQKYFHHKSIAYLLMQGIHSSG
jgi:hypothetical protein